MNKYQRIALTAGLLTFVSLAANASTITQTFSLPADMSQAPTNWTSSAMINQFDTSLGTLVAIRFILTGNANVHDSFTDQNASATCPSGPDCGTDTAFLTTVSDFHLKLGQSANPSSLPVLDIQNTQKTTNFNNLSFGQFVSFDDVMTGTSTTTYDVLGNTGTCANPGVGCLETPYTTITNSIFGLNGAPVDPLSVSSFLGTGTLPLSVRAYVSRSYIAGGGGTDTFSGTAETDVTVQYDYISSAPEPATFAMFGGALIGLGFLRKRISK